MILKTLLPVYLAQLARLVLPILVLPVVARRLEVDSFAALMSAQALAYLVMIVPEYGFATHGARAIAQARGDAERLAQAARAVVAAKLVLCLPALAAGTAAGLLLPTIGGDGALVAVAVGLGLALGLSPAWWFQGIGRAQTYAFAEIAAMGAFLALVLAIPYGATDAALVLALQAAPLALAVAGGHVAMARGVGLRWPGLAATRAELAGGFALFVAKLAGSGPSLGLVYVAGFLLAPAQVAVYAAAERVVMGAANALWPVMQVFMPEIASRRARDPQGAARAFARATMLLAGLGVGLAGGLAVSADLVVAVLFGPGYEAAAQVMRIAALALPAIALNSAVANGYLVVRGRDATVMGIQAASGALAILGAFALVGDGGGATLALVRLGVETWTMLAMVVAGLVVARQSAPRASLS